MIESLPRILIIDDQMDSVGLLLSFLKGQSIDIMVALDGDDGLRKAFDGFPDLILLDVVMPGMDGYSVCRKLKSDSRTASIPVIFLSANTTVEHKLEGFSVGGVDYICKPFSAEEVLARIYVHIKINKQIEQQQPAIVRQSSRVMATLPSREDEIISIAIAELQLDDFEWQGLEKFAQFAGTNEKKLTELFRKRFNMTVYEYLVELRLENARFKLSNTNIQIQMVAEHAGYRNASDFSRSFRRRYGLSPQQYRKVSIPSGNAIT